MTLHRAIPPDLPRIRELFARANDAPYDLARVAEEKCFGDGVAGAPEVRVYGDFAGVSVTCGRALRILAVDRAQRGRGIGTALLRDAEERGATIVAAEAGNYFTPGVAMNDETTLAFFRARGYAEVATTQNLIVNELPSAIGERRASSADRERILAFIEREFGRIWRFEAARAFDNDPPTMFVADDDSEVVGFAAHDANNRGLGFFGPTGVVRSQRGQGIGARLLRASLADLRRLGHDRAIIPWTDALAFYAKSCGATVHERFVTFSRTP